MHLYRVFPFDPRATDASVPGHPEYRYRPKKALGRLDNPTRYHCIYLATSQEGAVGEVFGDIPVWSDSMFDFPALPGARRAIAKWRVSDTSPLLDMDNAQTLADRALRPTDVISRVRPTTQKWALRVFEEIDSGTGDPTWVGVRWWSYHNPVWPVLGWWGDVSMLDYAGVEPLSMTHDAVVDAAEALRRPTAP